MRTVLPPLRPRFWWIVLGGSLAFLTASRVIQLRVFQAGIAVADAARPGPALDPRSPTGYADGQRQQILQPGDNYHWVMQTQQMIAQGTWRVRSVEYDNAPHGREVHWSGSMRWWLAAVAWCQSKITGEPWVVAVERAAVYANGLLLPLVLLGLVPVVAWRFGPWPASLLALGLTTVGAFRAEFGIGVLDHHGVACACELMMVVFLAAGGAGWIRGEKREGAFVALLPTLVAARRWSVASGIAGAVGLWISASTTLPVLVGIGAGALLAAWWSRADRATKTQVRFEPRLWRWWGWAGGGASLGFYALEYFPGPFALRLEVNHPLYALAWAAAGDLLCRVSEAFHAPATARGLRQRVFLFADTVVLAVPLLAILFLRERVFAVADSVFWIYRDFISEFSSALALLQKSPPDVAFSFLLRDVTVFPLLVLPAAVWLLKRGLPPAARSLLLVALAPAVLATVLGLQQVRWLNLSGSLWIAALVVCTQVRLALLAPFPWRNFEVPAILAFLGAVFLPFPFDTVSRLVRGSTAAAAPSAEEARAVVTRDVAHWLRHRTGGGPVVVASAAGTATDLIYFGGFKGMGTFYWENRAGLRDAVELHTARTSGEARAILQRHGAAYWVICSWDDFNVMSAGLDGRATKAPVANGPRPYLLDILHSRQPFPAWARPLPYAMPFRDRLKSEWVLVLEIVPPQHPLDGVVRRAQYLAANGQHDSAVALLEALAPPDSAYLPAQIQLATWHEAAGLSAAARADVERILPRLNETAELDLGDRIRLVSLLSTSGEAEAARQQLERTWHEADDTRLRRLTRDELEILLRLSRERMIDSLPAPASIERARAMLEWVRGVPAPTAEKR